MCGVCKLVPRAAGQNYCSNCSSRISSQHQSAKREESKRGHFFGFSKKSRNRQPPTDWREVLRKADEAKS